MGEVGRGDADAFVAADVVAGDAGFLLEKFSPARDQRWVFVVFWRLLFFPVLEWVGIELVAPTRRIPLEFVDGGFDMELFG